MPTFDTLGFVGLERSHLRSAVYRRVFGDAGGPVRIGRYSILERVGSGARGVVFKAFDNQLDRLVALKVLSTRADDHAELIREAKALARLSHPNVLAVYDVGETDEGQVFLATEYVKGGTLRSWFEEEHRAETTVVEVMQQVAAGVQAAHEVGLVHRDLKPANILLGIDGRVRVADFGLARFDPDAVDPDSIAPRDSVLTTTAGTPGYMAPELFRGDPASVASDQYALAITLQEILPDLPRRGRLLTAVRRGLAEAPEDRFGSVAEFAKALTPPRAGRSRKRAIALGIGLIGLGGATTAALVLPDGIPGPDPQVALLRAQAELPDNPRAALDALRPIAGWDDDRVLETAERALMLGPENASFALPEGSRKATLLGGLLFYRDGSDELAVRRLDDAPVAVAPSTVGLVDEFDDSSTIVRSDLSIPGARFDLHGDPALHAADPWAFRSSDESRHDISLSEDGRTLARIGDSRHFIVVTDTQTGEIEWSLDVGTDRYVNFVQLDATGSRLAWGDGGGKAEIRDLSTDVPLPLEIEASNVLFEPDGDHVIVHGRESGVFRTRTSDGHTIRLASASGGFGEVRLSPDGTWLAATSYDHTITVLRPAETVSHEIEGRDFAFSPDSSQLLVLEDDHMTVEHLGIWDQQVLSGNGRLMEASFASDGSIWSLWSDDRVRRHHPRRLRTLRGHEAQPTAIALSKDGSIAVSTGRDYTLRRWDVDTGTSVVLAELDWELGHVALDEDGGRVAVSKRKDATFLFDLETGADLGTAPHSGTGPVLGPEGALVGAGKDGVWSHDGRTTSFIAPELKDCGPIAASPKFVATVCGPAEDRTLHVWNGDRHDTAPMPDAQWLETLHVWPDASHLVFVGRRDQLASLSEDGIEVEELKRKLPRDDDFVVLTAASHGGDLVLRTRHGLHLAWHRGERLVDLYSDSSWGIQAISGDGLRVAYATNDDVQVVERELSASHRDLPSVLEAHALVEGKL